MPEKRLPIDTSFIHTYNWQSPETDIHKALDIITFTQAHPPATCPAARGDYSHISYTLAGHPETPAEVLEHLALCINHPKILERIATNANATKQTLKRLATDGRSEIRQAVAENSKIDLEIIELLVRDQHTDVRYALAENNNLPAEALLVLSSDENPYVAHRAERTRTLHRRGSTSELPPRRTGIRRVV
ncbi:MAG TPA: hypothetical protein V6D22_14925 [Candidatus Obscuribacterales bacterium]